MLYVTLEILRGLGTITSALAMWIKFVPTTGYALDFVARSPQAHQLKQKKVGSSMHRESYQRIT
jgi:hypothetical protein